MKRLVIWRRCTRASGRLRRLCMVGTWCGNGLGVCEVAARAGKILRWSFPLKCLSSSLQKNLIADIWPKDFHRIIDFGLSGTGPRGWNYVKPWELIHFKMGSGAYQTTEPRGWNVARVREAVSLFPLYDAHRASGEEIAHWEHLISGEFTISYCKIQDTIPTSHNNLL